MGSESEARDGAVGTSGRPGRERESGDGESDGDGGTDGETEAERLRRENRRLEAKLETERRRRERLIDRYEALVPDGSEGADAEARPDRGVASAVETAVRRGVARARRRLRALRERR